MAKGHDYGIVTKQDSEMRQFGGAKPVNNDHLTREDVYTAIRALMQSNPNFDKLTVQAAAQKVKNFLDDTFRGTLSVSGGAISDGETTIQLSHGRSNGESIIVAREKRRKR